jgi:hypothetical protein
MSRLSQCLFLTVLIVISLVTVSAMPFGGAQTSGTSVTGLIVTDTIWSPANSPYTLIGNMLVNTGATLTIQAGTTVNLSNYYLMVNGTLQAIGNGTNPVTFSVNTNNGGQLIFTPFCNRYNSISQTGCILENAVVNSQLIVGNSVQITQDTINDGINVQSQSNSMQTGTPVISNNVIRGGITVGNTLGSAIITNNNIVGGGISFGSMNPPNVTVSWNTISGCGVGISVSCWGLGFNNVVQAIEDNLIVNNTQGIVLSDWEGGSSPTIQDNTITNNIIGICVSYPWGNNSPSLNCSILKNNIYGNSKYDFQNQQPTTINATNNWWGTTDTQVISQKIYDYYDDFTIGVVTYFPFLTAINTAAPTYTPPTPTPTVTATPTPSSTLTPTPTPKASPTPAPTTNSTATPIPIATPTPSPQPQGGNTTQSSTLHASTDKGAIVDISITGNITSSQMSAVIIATNQSASTTVFSFTVIGQSGTSGFSNLTIAKNALPYGKTPTIYIDDQIAQGQGYTQDADNYYVWYTTHFSTHKISIVFTPYSNVEPGGTNKPISLLDIAFGAAVGVIIALVIVIALLLVTRVRKSKALNGGLPANGPPVQVRLVIPVALSFVRATLTIKITYRKPASQTFLFHFTNP